jgi:hypothetical protein
MNIVIFILASLVLSLISAKLISDTLISIVKRS